MFSEDNVGVGAESLAWKRSIRLHDDRFKIARSPFVVRANAAKRRPSLKRGCQVCLDLIVPLLRRRPGLSGGGHRLQSRS